MSAVPRVTKSSTVSVGAATVFVVIAATVGFCADDRPGLGCATWTLRGTLAPDATEPARKAGAPRPGARLG